MHLRMNIASCLLRSKPPASVITNRFLYRLTSSSFREYEREVETLEILKAQFSEIAFHNCDVMLRDFDESRRLRTYGIGNDVLVVTIISHVFWPPVQIENYPLHPC